MNNENINVDLCVEQIALHSQTQSGKVGKDCFQFSGTSLAESDVSVSVSNWYNLWDPTV